MDDNKAWRKEGERTLKCIRRTLNHLQDGSAWQDPLTQNDEFQWMKNLMQSGYSHHRLGPVKRFFC